MDLIKVHDDHCLRCPLTWLARTELQLHHRQFPSRPDIWVACPEGDAWWTSSRFMTNVVGDAR